MKNEIKNSTPSIEDFSTFMGFTLGDIHSGYDDRLGLPHNVFDFERHDVFPEKKSRFTFTEIYVPFNSIDITVGYLKPKNTLIYITLEVNLEICKEEYISFLIKKGVWDRKCQLIGQNRSQIIKVLGENYIPNLNGFEYETSFGAVRIDLLEKNSARCTGISAHLHR